MFRNRSLIFTLTFGVLCSPIFSIRQAWAANITTSAQTSKRVLMEQQLFGTPAPSEGSSFSDLGPAVGGLAAFVAVAAVVVLIIYCWCKKKDSSPSDDTTQSEAQAPADRWRSMEVQVEPQEVPRGHRWEDDIVPHGS